MPKLLPTVKGGSFNLIDAILLSLTKTVAVDGFITPRLLNRVTGGNMIFNTIIKAVGAGVVGGAVGGKVGRIIADALIVSSADEVIGGVLGRQAPAGAPRQPIGADTFGQANRGEAIVRFI